MYPSDRFLLVLCLLAPLPGMAAPPLQTDDAGVLAPGACELEALAARERAGTERTLARGLQGACGVGLNTQLALSAARAQTAGIHEDAMALSGKHGLWESAPEGEEASALALSWQVAQLRATGGHWRSLGQEVRVIGTQPLDSAWTLHVNLGHAHAAQGGSHSTLWGTALEHGPV